MKMQFSVATIVVFSYSNDNIVAINKELSCIKYLIHNDLLYLVAIVADLFQKTHTHLINGQKMPYKNKRLQAVVKK